MKAIIILLLISMSSGSMAQNLELDAFFIKHRHHPNTIAMALPGWLVKFGLNASEAKEDVDEYRPLLRGLNNIRLLVMEEKNYASQKEINRLITSVRKHRYVDLLSVKEGTTSVHILVKEKKTKKRDLIRHVMILVAEEDELVLLTLNGRWKKELLQKALKDGNIDFLGGVVDGHRSTETTAVAQL